LIQFQKQFHQSAHPAAGSSKSVSESILECGKNSWGWLRWEAAETEDGHAIFQHNEIENCTVQESDAAEVQGKYKNTVTLGK